MSYTQPAGMLPDDSKKEEKTTTDPGQLGYHTTRKSMKTLTDAINNSEPNKGPMRESRSGTYNFSKGFTLGGDKGGSFAGKHISGMKTSVSAAKEAARVASNKALHQKLISETPGAFMPKGGDDYTPDAQSGKFTPASKTKSEKVSIRKGDVTKGGTINTNQQTRGGFKSVKHYTTEEYTPEGVMTGANWQEKSKKHNIAAAQDAMRNKTSKERRQDKRQGKKDAAFNKKEQKGLTKALERQGREEYRSRENKPSGIANYGKTKNARQYGKAYAQQQLKMQKGL